MMGKIEDVEKKRNEEIDKLNDISKNVMLAVVFYLKLVILVRIRTLKN